MIDPIDYRIITGTTNTFNYLFEENGLSFRNKTDDGGNARLDRVPARQDPLFSDEIDDNFRKIRDAGRNIVEDLATVLDESNLLKENSINLFQNINNLNTLLNNKLLPAGIEINNILVAINNSVQFRTLNFNLTLVTDNQSCEGNLLRLTSPLKTVDYCVPCCGTILCDPSRRYILDTRSCRSTLFNGFYRQTSVNGCFESFQTNATSTTIPIIKTNTFSEYNFQNLTSLTRRRSADACGNISTEVICSGTLTLNSSGAAGFHTLFCDQNCLLRSYYLDSCTNKYISILNPNLDCPFRWRTVDHRCENGIRYRIEEDLCGLLPRKETEDGACPPPSPSCTPWEITHRVCVSLGYRRVYVMRTCDGGVVEYDDYLISDIGCNDPVLPPPDTL